MELIKPGIRNYEELKSRKMQLNTRSDAMGHRGRAWAADEPVLVHSVVNWGQGQISEKFGLMCHTPAVSNLTRQRSTWKKFSKTGTGGSPS